MTRIIIDPITRIEGHLKIECEITNNVVTDAWSSGTLFRGIEKILTGRAPEDAWLFTQRLCGVCTYVHGVCSVRCVENASGATIPSNARVVRNLLMGGQFVHDHPIHFYHLHGLDWVDVASASQADVAATEALARRLSPQAPAMDFADAKAKLQQILAGGQLGLFEGGYWGHPAMQLSPEENLLVVTHYLYALQMQIQAANMHAIFGAKNPHLQSLRVGGVTCARDITTARIAEFRAILTTQRHYIDTVYLPDACYLASKYAQDSAGAWARVGGSRRYLAYGEFPLGDSEPADLFFPRGVDGGTLGMRLVGPILASSKLIVIDCAFMGHAPGTVVLFTREMWPSCTQSKHSLHEVSLLETFALASLVGDLPETVIIGVEPADLSNRVGLSHEVKQVCSTVVDMVMAEVASSGGEAQAPQTYDDSFDPMGRR